MCLEASCSHIYATPGTFSTPWHVSTHARSRRQLTTYINWASSTATWNQRTCFSTVKDTSRSRTSASQKNSTTGELEINIQWTDTILALPTRTRHSWWMGTSEKLLLYIKSTLTTQYCTWLYSMALSTLRYFLRPSGCFLATEIIIFIGFMICCCG